MVVAKRRRGSEATTSPSGPIAGLSCVLRLVVSSSGASGCEAQAAVAWDGHARDELVGGKCVDEMRDFFGFADSADRAGVRRRGVYGRAALDCRCVPPSSVDHAGRYGVDADGRELQGEGTDRCLKGTVYGSEPGCAWKQSGDTTSRP